MGTVVSRALHIAALALPLALGAAAPATAQSAPPPMSRATTS